MNEMINGSPSAPSVGAIEIKRLEEQNIACKQMLAEVLRNDVHNAQLEYFEYYQNRFLEMDEKMRQLKTDLQCFEPPAAYLQHQEQHINTAPNGLAFGIKTRYDEICQDIETLSTAFKNYLDNRLSR